MSMETGPYAAALGSKPVSVVLLEPRTGPIVGCVEAAPLAPTAGEPADLDEEEAGGRQGVQLLRPQAPARPSRRRSAALVPWGRCHRAGSPDAGQRFLGTCLGGCGPNGSGLRSRAAGVQCEIAL